MPVRWVIHSSEVVKQRASRWLSTTHAGTAIPVPTIRALCMAAFRDGRLQRRQPTTRSRKLSRIGESFRQSEFARPPLGTGEARRPLLEERSKTLAMVGGRNHRALGERLPVE